MEKNYQFGGLRLSVQQQILYKDQSPILLAPLAFKILLVLVENAGEVVSREALRDRIWPNSYVEEAGLSKNISVLRTTLRPYFDEEFIRTWPKRGYQLQVPVTEIADEAEMTGTEADGGSTNVSTLSDVSAPIDQASPSNSTAGASRSIWFYGSALLCFLVVAAFLFVRYRNRPHPFPTGAWQAMPLTSGHDLEFEPATTSDGKQLAYVSRASGSTRFQIFQRDFTADVLHTHVLDTGPGDAFYPAWSPSADRIAFLRCNTGPCEIATVPSHGGPVRVVRVLPLYTLPDDQAYYQFRQLGPVWTGDGQSLIYPYQAPKDTAERLVQQDLKTGVTRQLTFGQQGDDDGAPAISHDGKSVAFLRRQLNHTDIMVLDLHSGSTRVLETEPNHTASGVTWAPDNSGVVVGVLRQAAAPSLLWVPLQGSPRLLTVALPGLLNPVFTGDGKALMVLSSNRNRNLAEVSGDAQNAELVFRTKQKNSFSALSPDSKRLAFLSDLSGRFEVWLSDRQGSSFTKPIQLSHDLPYYPVSIAWAPDGRTLAIGISHTNQVEIVDVASGEFQNLRVPGLEKSNVWSPAWAADGRSIYLAVHGERNGIVRASTTLLPSVNDIMVGDAQELRLDADRAIYFTTGNTNGIYKLTLGSRSTPQLVTALADINPARDWFIDQGKLFYLDLHDASRRLHSFDLTTFEAAVVTPPLVRPAFLDGSLTYVIKDRLLLYSEWTEEAGSQIFLLYPPGNSPRN